ncbi:hypothetical protein K402DRAFT_412819 [Aulographum hederae CBS 113979]|uniref:BZIP domain-containing protein n=1 Tax=Aulographum hederae CBS 113979 TaxID=1176131 RepID=A0A6G1GZ76_9PEZI|nr:hypothetical protein K402DRAFT_412819 [Aulographum hederae CBS 113979]
MSDGCSIGSAGSDTSSRSPLDRLGFGKFLSPDKKTTRDGQPPKRRGPKPDAKPALTRRQELNRQAQRTHRERKEMYIKALEQEVLRLKETFATTARERDAIAEENRRLKELLAAHGIHYDLSSPSMMRMGGSFAGSTSGASQYDPSSGSTGYTSPPSVGGSSMPHPLPHLDGDPKHGIPQATQHSQLGDNGLNYDNIGIDFVLALERPCMDHMQFLMIRSANSADDDTSGQEVNVSGHAMMATCPPLSHVIAHPDENYPHKMPDVGMPDLVKLLDLSSRLPLDGEITPIMAWAGIRSHPRFGGLTEGEIGVVKRDLLAKIRCYGFGAVLEEFEVRDAISSVLAAKDNGPSMAMATAGVYPTIDTKLEGLRV